jgi:hypothetical protein
VFVNWNQDLRDKSHKEVLDRCNQVFYNNQLDYELTSLPRFHIDELEKEIRIKRITLRMYNNNPNVFIDQKLNSFVTEVAKELFVVAKKLNDIDELPANLKLINDYSE